MKFIYLPILAMLLMFNTAAADQIDKVAELLGKGNAHELAKMFAANIEISINDEGSAYSKAQAEVILDKFFSQNKPTGSKILHRVNSNANYHFGVAIINTDKGPYRISFNLKGDGANMQLTELRIEKVK